MSRHVDGVPEHSEGFPGSERKKRKLYSNLKWNCQRKRVRLVQSHGSPRKEELLERGG